jgi:hypothetical protein
MIAGVAIEWGNDLAVSWFQGASISHVFCVPQWCDSLVGN